MNAPERTPVINPNFEQGQDWIVSFVPTAGSTYTFPDGTSATFVVYDTVGIVDPNDLPAVLAQVDATVSSGSVVFKMTSDVTDPIPANKAARAYITYPEIGTVQLFAGRVVRFD